MRVLLRCGMLTEGACTILEAGIRAQGEPDMGKETTQEELEQARPRSLLIWIVVATLLVASIVALTLGQVLPGLVHRDDRQASDWPTETWATSTPEEQGMDPGKLEAMMAYIDEHDMEVDSIIVVRHGRIVFEEYGYGWFPDTRHKLHSVTKSVTSMLVGIAIDQGLIEGVHMPLTELFPDRTMANVDARKAGITLEHLLDMSDGMDWHEHDWPYDDPRNPVNGMGSSPDIVQYVLDWPMARKPGEAWAYNSGASILLGAALDEATGRDLVAFAREVLFDPIGVGTIYWEAASGGHYYTHGGLSMTPRDMARLGYLMLHNGTWDGREIVPADWVARSTAAHNQASGSYGYGYQWWILSDGQGYEAAGLYDQKILVLPEADMVVVFTASIPSESLHHARGLVNTFILPACTDLVREPGRETYDDHGFNFEYPSGFFVEDAPIPGRDTLSDASGIVQITSNLEPVEMVSVLWDEAESDEEAPALLRAYLAGLAETGVEVAPGQFTEGKKSGHSMALQFSELTFEGGTVPAVTGAWNCEESGRFFAVTYVTAVEMASDELLAALEGYLEGLTCD